MTTLIETIATEVEASGKKHASGVLLVFDRHNLEAAIRRGFEQFNDIREAERALWKMPTS